MSARPRCNLPVGRLTTACSNVCRRPGLLWRGSHVLWRHSSYSHSSPNNALAAAELDVSAANRVSRKPRSRERVKSSRSKVDAASTRAAVEISKSAVPHGLVEQTVSSASRFGSVLKHACLQLFCIRSKLQAFHLRRQLEYKQKIARASHIRLARKYIGLPVKDMLLSETPQTVEDSQDIIMMAIDTEGGKKVTELGVAILDVRSISGIHPGPKAREWCKRIRTRHFDTRPYGSRFRFGITERVPHAAMKPYMQSLLSPTRKVVLVGHSLSGDLDKLSVVLGFDMRRLPNVIAQVDTLECVQGVQIPQKLSTLWKHLTGIGNEHDRDTQAMFAFHNAGNDAVCNLQVLLMLATTPEAEWVAPRPGRPLVGFLPQFHAKKHSTIIVSDCRVD